MDISSHQKTAAPLKKRLERTKLLHIMALFFLGLSSYKIVSMSFIFLVMNSNRLLFIKLAGKFIPDAY